MKKQISIIILVLIQLHSLALGKFTNPELPNWINVQTRDSLYSKNEYFVQFAQWKGVKSRDKIDKEKELIQSLKEKITQSILTSVSSLSVIQKNEQSGGKYSESYKSETIVFSDIKLFNSNQQTFYDKQKQILYGILTVNKIDLGNDYIKSVKSKLLVINNELTAYNTNINARTLQNDIANFNGRLETIEQEYQVIIATGVKTPDELSELFSQIRTEINKLYKNLHSTENEECIQKAQQYLIDGKTELALREFQLAQVKLPDDSRVVLGIEESKKRLETECLNRINNYTNKLKFNLALEQYEKLFNLLPEKREKYLKDYHRLEELSFDHFAEELNYALKKKTTAEIKIELNNLEKYQHIDRERFNYYNEKVNQALADDLYKQAKIKYHERNYSGSISTLHQAIDMNIEKSQYSDLLSKSQKKLFHQQLNVLKKQRPHLYSIQLGLGVQNQNNLYHLYEETDKWVVNLIPSFSLGIYRKFGIEENIRSNGRDKSKSNLIGFRYGQVFNQLNYGFDESEIIKTSIPSLHELNFVIGFYKKYTFNIGACSSTIEQALKALEMEYLMVSIARRMYLHPIEISIELKAYATPTKEVFPVLAINLLLNSNLIRKIDRHDKEKIQYKIEQQY